MWRRSLYLVLPLAISLNSQTAKTPDSANPSFKAKAQLVFVASTTLETTDRVPQAPAEQPSTQYAKEPEIIDIPVYCAHLSETVQHSSALASVCQFALFTLKRFPDLICQREMKSDWTEFRRSTAGDAVATYDSRDTGAPPYFGRYHDDVLTAQVTYRDGQEYYDHLLLNGQPISSEASVLPPSSLRGPWSIGEFGMILQAIFLPDSRTEFQFKKQTRLGSADALLFTFHVAAANNRYYFLFSEDKKWFPQYRGELWVDENGFRLLRLERQTGRMAQYPIRSVNTTIQYAPVSLADGTTVVLPINSQVKTCTVLDGMTEDTCSHSLVKFTDWHKFKTSTKVVTNPEH